MSDFHDPDLRQQLGRLSGPYPDQNEAFATWQRRVGQARRRRAMMLTTGGAMTAIIAVVAVAALQGPKGHTVKSGDRPQTSITITTHASTTEEPTTPSVADTVSTLNPAMVGEDGSTPTEPPVETTAPAPAPTDPPTSATQPPVTTAHKSGGGTSSSSQPPQTSATTQPKAPDVSKTESSVGGTVTVKLDGNRLEIVNIETADGFDSHKNDHYRWRIDVTFTSHDHTSYISFTVSNGQITSNVHESPIGNPGDNYGGGGDGGD